MSDRMRKFEINVEFVLALSYVIPGMPFPNGLTSLIDFTHKIYPKVIVIDPSEFNWLVRDSLGVASFGYSLFFALCFPCQHKGVAVWHTFESVVLYGLSRLEKLVFPDHISIPVNFFNYSTDPADGAETWFLSYLTRTKQIAVRKKFGMQSGAILAFPLVNNVTFHIYQVGFGAFNDR